MTLAALTASLVQSRVSNGVWSGWYLSPTSPAAGAPGCQTPSTTDHPQATWTHTTYRSAAGTVLLDATSEQGVSHNIPIQATSTLHFFGIDHR